MDLAVGLGEALDGADGIIEEVEYFGVVGDDLSGDFLAKHVAKEWITVLYEALGDHVAQLRDEALLHEHLVEFSFLCINQESSYGLKQVVKDLFEVYFYLIQFFLSFTLFPLDNLVKNLEEAVDVAVRDLQRNHWTLNR